MELKQFIKSSIQSIVNATKELIEENAEHRIYINPAVHSINKSEGYVSYHDGFAKITTIEFDVAVTEGTERQGGGGLKVDVAAFKVGADGTAGSSYENASRIKFAVGIVLPHTKGPPNNKRLE